MVAFASSVESPLTEVAPKDSTELGEAWRVVVLNDPVNLMSYVTMILKRVLRMSHAQAEKHMMEVHQRGRSVVWIGQREKAEGYVYQLQRFHLQAILERDESD